MSIAAAKELMSFFSYFQALQLKTNHTYDYPGFDGAGKGQGSRTQVDSKTLCMNIPIGIVHQFTCLESSWTCTVTKVA